MLTFDSNICFEFDDNLKLTLLVLLFTVFKPEMAEIG